MSTKWRVGTGIVALSFGLGLLVVYGGLGSTAQAQAAAPRYLYDPGWPKPLPNKWKMGGITGLAVAPNDDTIWAYDRPNDLTNIELEAELNPPIADCCTLPPSMLHFDKEGNLIGSFAAPQGHGMDVDSKGFAYLGQNTVRKYDTKTGKLVGAIEHSPETEGGGTFQQDANLPNHTPGQGGQGPVVGFLPPPPGAARGGGRGGGRGAPPDPAAQAAARAAFRAKYPPTTPMIVGGIEEIRVDEPANEIYVADGYVNHRVVVFDATTGAYKRHWGAYGTRPDDGWFTGTGEKLPGPFNGAVQSENRPSQYDPKAPPAPQFRIVHAVRLSKDGLVYVCDRTNNRLQVFRKDGRFVREVVIAKDTFGSGSVWDVGFSTDPQQQFLFVNDGTNQLVYVLDRDRLEIVSTFGGAGHWAGQFYGAHNLAVNSKGDLFITETYEGKRVQRFAYAGLGEPHAAP